MKKQEQNMPVFNEVDIFFYIGHDEQNFSPIKGFLISFSCLKSC